MQNKLNKADECLNTVYILLEVHMSKHFHPCDDFGRIGEGAFARTYPQFTKQISDSAVDFKTTCEDGSELWVEVKSHKPTSTWYSTNYVEYKWNGTLSGAFRGCADGKTVLLLNISGDTHTFYNVRALHTAIKSGEVEQVPYSTESGHGFKVDASKYIVKLKRPQ